MGALTKAQQRVLIKAKSGVRRVGAYSGAASRDLWKEPNFDRPRIIDELIADGLLAPAEAFNVYVLTSEGLRRLARMRQRGANE